MKTDKLRNIERKSCCAVKKSEKEKFKKEGQKEKLLQLNLGIGKKWNENSCRKKKRRQIRIHY